jgi:hypothetical protein
MGCFGMMALGYKGTREREVAVERPGIARVAS